LKIYISKPELKKLILNKMLNDYECPRCHNRFPTQNIVMHDRMCTNENPMALDKSRQEKIKESNISNKNIQISNSNVKISQKKPPEEIKKSEVSKSIPPLQNSQLKKSGEFPNIFTCEICHEVLPESEKNDHMYCHDLQNEENNVHNNEDQFRITQSQIDNQREIERQIKRDNEQRRQNEDQFRITQSQIENQREIERQIKLENEQRRQQQNQRNNERGRNENQARNNRSNRNENNDLNFMNNFFEDFSNLNINNSNINNPSSGGVRQVRIQFGGPNGPRIVEQFSGNDRRNINNNMRDPFDMFFNGNSLNTSQRRTINFMDIENGNFNSIIEDLLGRLRSRENPTDQEILNELPETTIDDVNKLDPEKKNCVICLEDFKNGDKATVLPCIHMFHTSCIQNWLKTQNSCPICKFKLTGENINSQH
jgi:hypothetical protein